MENLLQGLRAAGEETRLRLLVLCGHSELTVSELTQILGQSQPRVSRHLKLLCEAGLLDRYQEGSWVFYRLSAKNNASLLARTLVDLVPEADPIVSRDLDRLESVKKARIMASEEYFRENAARWREIRSLHVPEEAVEEALLDLTKGHKISDFLDIGTGTGRMLELFGPKVTHAIGVDTSREMLSFARTAIEDAGLRNCQVRLADMYNLPFTNQSQDAIVIHQVLHYAEDPAVAIREAARLLRSGGILAIVDFAPHTLDSLRTEHAHRHMGFDEDSIRANCIEAGLEPKDFTVLKGDPLTVNIWTAVPAAIAQSKGAVAL
ncbi:metalloregulator ArsR/SmtB family transcription factor [Sneathiella sp. CAU 1612]|uniref:Metalloregulator ArsR/SmtB family transcription factor n=1 Tax=Sneathiella sedimenti TaxID=2816034 RepID=A0ABS3F572_9PROT|nr:metalloregulator ArsR/SmtB family transcription factor [uncultured Sneathiella sp.]MBO0333679.1 metalloregulator ArsR/SmtB family transcription factor [Sneathiella sedimenti]